MSALDLLQLARFLELAMGEVAMRLHQAVAGAAVLEPVRHRHGFLHEACQHRERVAVSGIRVDATDGLEREPALEHAKAPEHGRFVCFQEAMAPIDRRRHRLLALGYGPRARREHSKPIVEVDEQLPLRHEVEPGRRHLDGQRKTVEPFADRRHGLAVGLRNLEVRQHEPGARLEQVERVRVAERGHRPANLTRHAERLAAGGQDGEGGAAFEECVGERCALGDEVLAVVEDEQSAARCQPGGRDLPRRAATRQLEIRDDRSADVAFRRQRHPPDAIGPGITRCPRKLRGETALACAAGTGQSDDPRVPHERLERAQIGLAAHEGREMERQIVRNSLRLVALAGHRAHPGIFAQPAGNSQSRRGPKKERGTARSLSPVGAPWGIEGACRCLRAARGGRSTERLPAAACTG